MIREMRTTGKPTMAKPITMEVTPRGGARPGPTTRGQTRDTARPQPTTRGVASVTSTPTTYTPPRPPTYTPPAMPARPSGLASRSGIPDRPDGPVMPDLIRPETLARPDSPMRPDLSASVGQPVLQATPDRPQFGPIGSTDVNVTPQQFDQFREFGDAVMQEYQRSTAPEIEARRRRMDQTLINRGLTPGSEGYEREMDRFMRMENDLFSTAQRSALAQGLEAQNQAFQQGLGQAGINAGLRQTQMGAEASMYGADRSAAASIYGSDSSRLASEFAARLGAETSMYGADRSAETSMYNAELANQAQMYGVDSSRLAQMYGADSSRLASMYGSELGAHASMYGADASAGATLGAARIGASASQANAALAAETARQNAALAADTQRYGYDQSLAGTQYTADSSLERALADIAQRDRGLQQQGSQFDRSFGLESQQADVSNLISLAGLGMDIAGFNNDALNQDFTRASGAVGGFMPGAPFVPIDVNSAYSAQTNAQAARENIRASNSGQLTSGIGALGSALILSDRNVKRDIKPIDKDQALDAIRKIEVSRWKYNGDDREHIGPMAQDFGEHVHGDPDATEISVIDAIGTLTASVQALADRIDRMENAHA